MSERTSGRVLGRNAENEAAAVVVGQVIQRLADNIETHCEQGHARAPDRIPHC